MKIYIVSGALGELDDYSEWLVKGFTTHDKAAEYAILCKGEADSITYPGEKPNRYDVNMPISHYEINYFVQELELED